MLFWILWLILTPLICIFLPTRIIGKKYIKTIKGKASIFACNHQTMNDPIILKCRVNTRFKLVAKSGLFKSKFGKWFFTKLGAYPVNRGGNDISFVKNTLGFLKDQKSIVIFPEGTRVKVGETVELKNGVSMFALKTDCYIIPAFFKKRTNPFVFNTLLIGEPFKFSDYEELKDQKPSKEILNTASNILSEKLSFLKNISIKGYKKLIKLKFKELKETEKMNKK